MSRHRSSQSPATHLRRNPQARAVLATFAGTLAGAPLIAPPVLLAQESSGPESALRRFDIPSGDLGRALSAAAVRGGVQLSFDPKLTRGKTTPGLSGELTAREALAKLLAGSGLELVPGPGRTYGLQSVPKAAAKPAKKPVQAEPIEVLEPIEVIGKPLDQDQGFKADMQDSATKFPLSIRETPQSISVITQDALEARQVITLGQALETAAGVHQFQGTGPFAGRASFGQGQTQIRGIRSNFYTDRDEGFPSPIPTARPDLAPYERIEVVKGPTSVLYGRSTAGGFVNRVRKKPLGVFASELDASVGSFDFYRAEGDVTGPLFASEQANFGVDHTTLEYGYVGGSALLYNPNDQADRPNIYEENFADFPTQPTPTSFIGWNEQKGTGVYAQAQFRPFERLSVLLGGRYDRSDTLNEDRFNNTRSEKQDEDFTGRVGLVFDVSRQVSVYGLYAQSFDPVLDAGEGGTVLEPETGEIFEAGIKTEWLDGKLGVNLALFRLDRQDIPIGVPTPPGVPGFSVSGGLQRTDGIELEINGEPLPGWNLSFGGSWSDYEFVEGPFVGSTPTGAADWQLGAYTSYELHTGALKGLGLGAGLFAIDERGGNPFLGVTSEGYERVDLSLFYNGLKHTKIALQVRNVFDERYLESENFLNGGQFGSPTAVLLTVRGSSPDFVDTAVSQAAIVSYWTGDRYPNDE